MELKYIKTVYYCYEKKLESTYTSFSFALIFRSHHLKIYTITNNCGLDACLLFSGKQIIQEKVIVVR